METDFLFIFFVMFTEVFGLHRPHASDVNLTWRKQNRFRIVPVSDGDSRDGIRQ